MGPPSLLKEFSVKRVIDSWPLQTMLTSLTIWTPLAFFPVPPFVNTSFDQPDGYIGHGLMSCATPVRQAVAQVGIHQQTVVEDTTGEDSQAIVEIQGR